MNINIGLVDDHQLFSKSLELMLASFKDFTVVVDAVNGIDLQQKMKTISVLPDIMLIDVNMPMMNGRPTCGGGLAARSRTTIFAPGFRF